MREDQNYQQQYPQQAYDYGQQYRGDYSQLQQQPQSPQDKNPKIILTGFMIFILVAAIGLYFVMKPKMLASIQPNTSTSSVSNVPSSQQQNFKQTEITKPFTGTGIITLRLCSGINQNFNCQENIRRKFQRGKTFYISADIIATSKNKKILLTNQIKIINDKGYLLLNTLGDDISQYEETDGIYHLPIKKGITFTDSDPLGNGTIQVTITDKITNTNATKTIGYELVE